MKPVVIPVLVGLSLVGCQKDNTEVQGGIPMLDHLELSVDSACVQAPNVITPFNHDGVNDVFAVLITNVASVHTEIVNAEGDVIITSDDPNFLWDGTDSTGSGPYRVHVQATSTSGQILQGVAPLHVLMYGSTSCIEYDGTPVCGDQLDPRRCGYRYPTNEVFCP
ncbi:MAG: gliding motility-associated C-terminal domain-containing protein [Flavobacteriales bacterium]|nr:gliding motility-associated C-terminal domain-containing protein [Flavobacteriales bacterium]